MLSVTEYVQNHSVLQLILSCFSCQIYNVFALFWCLFFTSALAEMVLAGAFASWYWAYDKSKDLPTLPVLDSLGRTLRLGMEQRVMAHVVNRSSMLSLYVCLT